MPREKSVLGTEEDSLLSKERAHALLGSGSGAGWMGLED